MRRLNLEDLEGRGMILKTISFLMKEMKTFMDLERAQLVMIWMTTMLSMRMMRLPEKWPREKTRRRKRREEVEMTTSLISQSTLQTRNWTPNKSNNQTKKTKSHPQQNV